MNQTIREIQETTARVTGIGVKDILSQCRDREITRARWIAIYATRLRTGSSLPEIGRAFNRDHTSIMHAIHEIDYRVWVRGEPSLFEDITAVCRDREIGDWRRA